MIRNEGSPELAEAALKSVLQFLALEPDEQFAHYSDPKECVTCRVPGSYGAIKKRYGHAEFFRELDAERTAVLADLEALCLRAVTAPNHCGRRELLAEGHWARLRDMAKALLTDFGCRRALPIVVSWRVKRSTPLPGRRITIVIRRPVGLLARERMNPPSSPTSPTSILAG